MVNKPRVRVIFLGLPKGVPKWPTIDFDTEERIKIIKEKLLKNISDVEFIGWNWVKSNSELEELSEEIGSKGEDVVIVFNIASGWFNVTKIAKKIPLIAISDPLLWGYAGMTNLSSALRKEGARGFIVSSSDWNDILRIFKVVKAYHALKNSRILIIGDYSPEFRKRREEQVKELGVKLIWVSFDELRKVFKETNVEEAEKLAKEIYGKAEKVVEPDWKTLVDSARMYLALKKLIREYNANGVTMNCLGGFYSGKLDAYPCIAFMLFDDEGTTMAACEGDIESLLTKIAMKEIANRPGFLSEPAIDTSKNLAIYAHCVSATKLNGYDKSPEPFYIRSHAEDNKGASVQVLSQYYGIGTIVKIVPGSKQVLLLRGWILGHMEQDLACRTKIVVNVNDAQGLIDNWRHSWHRVLYYGDWSGEIEQLAKLLGYELIVEEGSY